MNLAQLPGAPFDAVLDVGGNIGLFAEQAHATWPAASVVSFEPIPGAALANRERSRERWRVIECAVSEYEGTETLWFCRNQHSASTMQAPGTARRKHFGLVDQHEALRVRAAPLDSFLPFVAGCKRLLVKVDVEGHEAHVIAGARRTLDLATTVVCEVQQDATIFLGSPSPLIVDGRFRSRGLYFAGLAGAFLSPADDVLQFDGVWTRDLESWRAPEHAAQDATGIASGESASSSV